MSRFHIVRSLAQLDCDARQAWDKVCFYEHIELQPTWLLRVALPVPQRTTGAYRKAGDISSCQYSDGGYLTKRILEIEEGRVDFEVIEQSIRYAGRIDLRGGTICVTPRAAGGCTVEMVTRYELSAAWLELLRAPIDYVVKAMHRIVLRDMRARLEPAGSAVSLLASGFGLLDPHALAQRGRECGADDARIRTQRA